MITSYTFKELITDKVSWELNTQERYIVISDNIGTIMLI